MKLKNDKDRFEGTQAASSLMSVMPAVMQFVRVEMRSRRERSLSVPQFRVLTFLGRHPGASLSNVAEHVGVAKATASTLITRLVEQGLVSRQTDPNEGRQIVLTLTSEGTESLTIARQRTHQKLSDKLRETLSVKELEQVTLGLSLVAQSFDIAIEIADSFTDSLG